MTQDSFENLLKRYCDPDGYNGRCKAPFVCGDYLCATDAHICLFFPTDWLKQQGIDIAFATSNTNYPQTAVDLLNKFVGGKQQTFDADFFARLRKSYEADHLKDSVPCGDCGGKGVVNYTYFANNGDTYDLEAPCPVCDGEGYAVKYFAARFIDRLIGWPYVRLIEALMLYFDKPSVVAEVNPDEPHAIFRFNFGEFWAVVAPAVGCDYEIKID